MLACIRQHPPIEANTACRLGANEIYERVKGSDINLAELARGSTDDKADRAGPRYRQDDEKLAWAQKLATRRLAIRRVPELDDCLSALDLQS